MAGVGYAGQQPGHPWREDRTMTIARVAVVLVLIGLLPTRVATAGQVADYCKLMDSVVADGFDGVTDATVEYTLCRDPKSIVLADCSDLRHADE